jgi:hypothetical protein
MISTTCHSGKDSHEYSNLYVVAGERWGGTNWQLGRGMMERDGGASLTNLQCKPIQKCHNEFPSVQLMYAN